MIGELINCVYGSLVFYYVLELEKMIEIIGKKIEKFYIVGGGSNVVMLN